MRLPIELYDEIIYLTGNFKIYNDLKNYYAIKKAYKYNNLTIDKILRFFNRRKIF